MSNNLRVGDVDSTRELTDADLLAVVKLRVPEGMRRGLGGGPIMMPS